MLIAAAREIIAAYRHLKASSRYSRKSRSRRRRWVALPHTRDLERPPDTSTSAGLDEHEQRARGRPNQRYGADACRATGVFGCKTEREKDRARVGWY
jgi:hypothetical protein